jgi:hypothetical protein
MTRRCVAFFVGLMRLYFGKTFARWVYKHTNARNDTTMRCLFSDGCVCIEVTYLQDGFTKIQTHEMTRRCVAFFFSDGCVCIFVTYLQDGFTNIQTHAMTRRCAAIFIRWMRLYLLKTFARWGLQKYKRTFFFLRLMRLYLSKIFARWVYKHTNARNDTTIRCLFLGLLLCILVKHLQDGFTKIQTHAMTRRCVAFFSD